MGRNQTQQERQETNSESVTHHFKKLYQSIATDLLLFPPVYINFLFFVSSSVRGAFIFSVWCVTNTPYVLAVVMPTIVLMDGLANMNTRRLWEGTKHNKSDRKRIAKA